MPLQNRVLPSGDIVTDPARGMFTGNRGVLHKSDKTLGVSRWKHPHWIICALEYKGWQRRVMTPGRWTELFFLDEAVALSAGHRPCALCRRAAYNRFLDAWQGAFGDRPKAPALDGALHRARLVPGTRTQKTFAAPLDRLPTGAFCIVNGLPHLVHENRLLQFSPGGYTLPKPRANVGPGPVRVLTPAPTIAAMAAGYLPALHFSALCA